MKELTDSELLDFLDWCAGAAEQPPYLTSDFQLHGNAAGFSVLGELNPSTYTGSIRETIREYHRIVQERKEREDSQ